MRSIPTDPPPHATSAPSRSIASNKTISAALEAGSVALIVVGASV